MPKNLSKRNVFYLWLLFVFPLFQLIVLALSWAVLGPKLAPHLGSVLPLVVVLGSGQRRAGRKVRVAPVGVLFLFSRFGLKAARPARVKCLQNQWNINDFQTERFNRFP